jgi:hypothetical protein
MSRVRRACIALLAVMLVSCDMLPGAKAKGPTTEFERQVAALAQSADLVDRPFEDLLTQLDLQKTFGARATEILEQIHKTRAAVAAARKAASAAHGPGLASVAAAVGTFSVPQFAIQFGNSLDPLTKAGGTRESPGRPYNSQETGAESFTTTTLSTTEIFTGEKAHVTGTLKWSYSTITIETKTGATLLHMTDERSLIGGIDVCPDAGGTVPATLDVTANIVAQVGAVTTTKRSTAHSSFEGSVSDQAALTSVTQKAHSESSTESATGNSGYSADHTATWNANDSGDYVRGLDAITGTVTPNGAAAAAADAATAAGWDLVLDAYALEPGYKAAQDLWRHGRCVMVTAPDYNAETPINLDEQGKSQNDKAVDPKSETKFSVGLKHRFESGALNQAVTAALSGDKKLEPQRLDSAPSTLTYTAPDDEGKKATATLKSTSKRGIGTLVLDFHTAKQALTLTITGTLKLERRFFGTSTEVDDTVSIGPLEFKKFFDDTWQGTGTWSAQTRSIASVPGSTQTCTGTQRGTITMIATYEDRGGKKVWVIDGNDADVAGTATSSCPGTDPEGDSAAQFLGVFKPIVIPDEGGTIAIHGAQGDPSLGAATADGTVKATTKK